MVCLPLSRLNATYMLSWCDLYVCSLRSESKWIAFSSIEGEIEINLQLFKPEFNMHKALPR